jgi:serine/threonine protein kinase
MNSILIKANQLDKYQHLPLSESFSLIEITRLIHLQKICLKLDLQQSQSELITISAARSIYKSIIATIYKGQHNDYICLGPSYYSSDGEYRHYFMPLSKLMQLDMTSPHIEFALKYVIKVMNHSKFYLPDQYKHVLQNALVCCFIMFTALRFTNIINQDFIELIYYDADVCFSHKKTFRFLSCFSVPVNLGIKNIHANMSTNQELYYNKQASKLVINLVCMSFPVYVGSIILMQDLPEYWDSLAQQNKIIDSKIIISIIDQLESTRKLAANAKIASEINCKIKHIMQYAMNNNILTNKIISIISEYAGAPLYVYMPLDPAAYLFQLLYAIHCMHGKLGIIHTDLHLNNILVSSIDIAENKSLIEVYVVNNAMYFTRATYQRASIIDFSRCKTNADLYELLGILTTTVPGLDASYDELNHIRVTDPNKFFNICGMIDYYKAFSNIKLELAQQITEHIKLLGPTNTCFASIANKFFNVYEPSKINNKISMVFEFDRELKHSFESTHEYPNMFNPYWIKQNIDPNYWDDDAEAFKNKLEPSIDINKLLEQYIAEYQQHLDSIEANPKLLEWINYLKTGYQ